MMMRKRGIGAVFRITREALLRIALPLTLAAMAILPGCAEVTVSCATGQTTQATVAGQDFSTFISALSSISAIAAPLVAGKAPTPAPALTAMRDKASAPSAAGTPAGPGTVSVKTTTFGGPIGVTCSNMPTPSGAVSN